VDANSMLSNAFEPVVDFMDAFPSFYVKLAEKKRPHVSPRELQKRSQQCSQDQKLFKKAFILQLWNLTVRQQLS